MAEAKVYFTFADLQRLTAEASALAISRSKLIRTRALVSDCQNGLLKLDTMAYHCLVAGASRHIGGHIPKHLVEQIVIYVLSQLTKPQADTSMVAVE